MDPDEGITKPGMDLGSEAAQRVGTVPTANSDEQIFIIHGSISKENPCGWLGINVDIFKYCRRNILPMPFLIETKYPRQRCQTASRMVGFFCGDPNRPDI
jgi:hypothetical protein